MNKAEQQWILREEGDEGGFGVQYHDWKGLGLT